MGFLDSLRKVFFVEEKKALTLKRPDGWPGMGVWDSYFDGISVNDQSSLTSSAYFASLLITCNTVAILPKQIRVRTKTGSEVDRNHDQFRLINKRANPFQSSGNFFKEFAFNRRHRGNGLAWLEGIDKGGRAVAYWNLNPLYADFDLQDGDAFIRYSQKMPNGKTLDGWRPYREFLHCPNDVGINSWTGAIWGKPSYHYSAQSIRLDLVAEKAGLQYLAKNGIVKDYFKHPENLSREQREILANSLAEYGPGGKKEGQRPLLDGGMEIKGLDINLSDIDLDRVRKNSLESQARFQTFAALFKLGHHERANFANAYQASVEFVTTTMLPVTQPIQEELDYKVLRNRETDSHFVNFEYKTLLQSEPEKQAEFLRSVFNMGSVESNTVAELLDMPTLGDTGNRSYVMNNMIPTDMVDEYWRTLIQKAGQMKPTEAKEIIDKALATNGVHESGN